MTGDANFSMESTCLTVGGFSQPSVARVLGRGLSQRFLWLFPRPSYSRFGTLEAVDYTFTEKISKLVLYT